MSNYIEIDGIKVLPEIGDIICKERTNTAPDEYYDDFEAFMIREVVGLSVIDSGTGYPTFRTKSCEGDCEMAKHKIIGSYFGEYYIIKDKSKRNKAIKSLLDDD